MSIPTAVELLNRAGRDAPGSLIDISNALDLYHVQATTTQEKIDILKILYGAVRAWLRDHKTYVFGSQSEVVVEALKPAVEAKLNELMPGLGDYTKRKAQGAAGNLTSLSADYSLERQTFLSGNKAQSPYSASLIHDKFDRFKKKNSNVQEFGQMSPSALSVEQFERVGSSISVRMYFLRKEQRLRLWARNTNNGWVDIDNQLLTTDLFNPALGWGAMDNLQMYAMDRYGNIFVDYSNLGHAKFRLAMPIDHDRMTTYHQAGAAARQHRGQTNHSSFCAGKDIICAGMIFFWKGQLLHIDNASGHYKPNREALRKTVKVLKDENAHLGYLRVNLFGVGYFKAEGFLKNKTRGDWPSQEEDDHKVLWRHLGAQE